MRRANFSLTVHDVSCGNRLALSLVVIGSLSRHCLLLTFVAFMPVTSAPEIPAVATRGRIDELGGDRSAFSQKHPKKATASPQRELTTKAARLAFIRKARIWVPTHVAEMDLRAGPQGAGAFQPNDAITCDYVEKNSLPGTTQKFQCAISKDDVAKVRYGATNGKVQGAVLATRL